MSNQEVPPAVQQLIRHQLRSVDHVAVLLAVRTSGAVDAEMVSARTMLAPSLATDILQELHGRELLTRHESEYRFEPDASLAHAVSELAEMYNTRPVTLVRAIYDRPASNKALFVDGTRRCRSEDGV